MSDYKMLSLVSQSNELETKLEKMLVESGGEITEEISELLVLKDATLVELEGNAERMALSIEKLRINAEYYQEQYFMFKDLAEGLEKTAERIEDAILGAMERLNIDELQGQMRHFKIARNPPRVDIPNAASVPPQFKKIEVTESIDKTAIKKHIQDGNECDFARLIQTKSLRIKTGRTKK